MTDDTQRTCWYADEELGIVTDGKTYWHPQGWKGVEWDTIDKVLVPYHVVKKLLEKKENEK